MSIQVHISPHTAISLSIYSPYVHVHIHRYFLGMRTVRPDRVTVASLADVLGRGSVVSVPLVGAMFGAATDCPAVGSVLTSWTASGVSVWSSLP